MNLTASKSLNGADSMLATPYYTLFGRDNKLQSRENLLNPFAPLPQQQQRSLMLC
jgi:hypothetical protein